MSTQTLQMLLDLATDKRESAARILGIERNALAAEKNKLDMLLAYREQYENATQGQAQQGTTVTQMRNAAEFLQRLSHAIEQQRTQIRVVDGRISMTVQELASAQAEVRKYETLIARKEEEARRTEQRREQKLNDEMAARLVRHVQE
jgi:flagellar FliJ protein